MRLILLLTALVIAPMAQSMMEDDELIFDPSFMTFDDALKLESQPHAMTESFVAILANWSSSLGAWENATGEQRDEIRQYLTQVSSLLNQMVTIKERERDVAKFHCFFDIDGTLLSYNEGITRTLTPTLMLYHAAVALGYTVHVISARHVTEDRNGGKTKCKLRDIGMDTQKYTLHLHDGEHFNTFPIEDRRRAQAMGDWKHAKRHSILGGAEAQSFFTIDDIPECLPNDDRRVGDLDIDILVPFSTLATHHMANPGVPIIEISDPPY